MGYFIFFGKSNKTLFNNLDLPELTGPVMTLSCGADVSTLLRHSISLLLNMLSLLLAGYDALNKCLC